jgi:3-deoxy-7-phosphoheptulonate synthase
MTPHAHTPSLTTHDTTRIDDTRIGAVRPLITPALLFRRCCMARMTA